MNPERWTQIKSLVEKALEQPASERMQFITAACQGDLSLLKECEKLILADAEMEGFLDFPAHKLLDSMSGADTVKFDEARALMEARLKTGETFAGKYQIMRSVGKGGMGRVYQARHLSLDTTVAIKVLHGHLVADDEAIERFKREARAAAKLDHPNTVRVYDYGAQGMICYLVMEYLEGESLRARLNKIKKFPPQEVIAFAEQVCNVLGVVHGNGIIHRDLKPDNIFFQNIDGSERVKLLDFGIAKLNTLTQSADSLTHAGAVFGTPQYMSPEQCQGQKLDARSDIYSLGIILYEMLAGRRPFEADSTLSYMYAHVHTVPGDLSTVAADVPPQINRAIMRAIAKNPNDRFPDAEALLQAMKDETPLETVAREMPADTSPSGATTLGLPHNPPANRTPLYLIAASMILIVISVVAVWRRQDKTAPPLEVENRPAAAAIVQVEYLPVGDDFVLIQGGETVVGRNPEECRSIPDCEVQPDEAPAHKVNLAPYYLSKYEVTRREYREFILANNQKPPREWLELSDRDASLPVTNISWQQASDYCQWRSRRDKVKYRLPTEEEWEYAARGGDTRLFPWGNIWQDEYANANKEANKENRPLPVDSAPNNTKDLSPLGIYAMAGNVREWTASDFKLYSGSEYKIEKNDLKCKIVRGGSYDTDISGLRTTFRAWLLPNDKRANLGFRLAADAVVKE